MSGGEELPPDAAAEGSDDDGEGAAERAALAEKEKEAAVVAAAAEKEAAKEAQAKDIAANRLAGPTSLAEAAREMATASTGQAVTGWQYDNASGYYYDVASQTYFDPKSQCYFVNGQWLQSAAPTAAQLATGQQSGSFKKGTRKPDRFGL